MSQKTVKPYGTWDSPITVNTITDTDSVADLVDILVDPLTSQVYHIEKRPAEGGRDTLVHTQSGRDITAPSAGTNWDVKSKVNGYGGAPAIVFGGVAYFSHASDGRLYRLNVEAANPVPEAITPENSFHKFANFDVCPVDPTILVGLFEDHTGCKTPVSVVNSLCFINTSTKSVFPLTSDASFYSSPKFSPDSKHLVWVEWDLPDMPWNGSEIWVADIVTTDGPKGSFDLQNLRHVAGEHSKVSVAYPTWLSNHTVLFTSDVSGFENPWTYDCTTKVAKPVFEAPLAEAFALRDPPKKLGWSPYAVANGQATEVLFTAMKDGHSVLYLVDVSSGTAKSVTCPYVEIHNIRALDPALNQVVFIGTTADSAPALVQCTLSSQTAVFVNLQSDSHGSTLTAFRGRIARGQAPHSSRQGVRRADSARSGEVRLSRVTSASHTSPTRATAGHREPEQAKASV
ncbi:hypothetical protein R3P38DRAFT_3132596 [Favolaschia claudopus]|uniref:Uncharacterized protein n=1 Tax=Favolaschia claudopus TaxID=2862362 RepID=A0AAV9Z8B9_9AGAR